MLDSPVDALCLYLHIYLPVSVDTHIYEKKTTWSKHEGEDVCLDLAEDQAEPIERIACEMMKKKLVCH